MSTDPAAAEQDDVARAQFEQACAHARAAARLADQLVDAHRRALDERADALCTARLLAPLMSWNRLSALVGIPESTVRGDTRRVLSETRARARALCAIHEPQPFGVVRG